MNCPKCYSKMFREEIIKSELVFDNNEDRIVEKEYSKIIEKCKCGHCIQNWWERI